MASVELRYNRGGPGENFGMLEARLSDGDFAMRAASVEGERNLRSGVIPIEGVFHFVAVKIVVTIGNNLWRGDINTVLAEDLGDEEGFLLIFVGKIKNLPGGGGEITGVFGGDAVRGRMGNFGSNSFVVVRFFLGNLEIGNFFARESVPEKDFAAVRVSAEGLATRDEFFYGNHIGNYNTDRGEQGGILG